MRLLKEPDAEPIPGYRLVERLGGGGFGDVWKCEAPGGLFKAVKFVRSSMDGLDRGSCEVKQELEALRRIKAIRHPFLLSLDRVEVLDGELVVVMELADKSLDDLLREHQAAGRAGVPRDELLGYLCEAAEVLDLMSLRHGLQHLDIKPPNLFLVGNHVKVADFGLVNSATPVGGADQPAAEPGGLTPRYAAPERFLGRISPSSDQYSLAIVYQELLTGSLPFSGKNSRQLLLQHTQDEPDLRTLPVADRPAVARALAKDPPQRFATCMDFVVALGVGRSTSTTGLVARTLQKFNAQPAPESAAGAGLLPPLLEQLLAERLAAAAGDSQVCERNGIRYQLQSGKVIRHLCRTRLPPEAARHNLEGFRRQWRAEAVSLPDEEGVVFRVRLPRGFLPRYQGQEVGLAVLVRLKRPQAASLPLTEVTVQISPLGGGKEHGADAVQAVGPLLLESLHARLQPEPERRAGERLSYDQAVVVRPVFAQGEFGPPLAGQGRDFSTAGMRVWLPRRPPTPQVHVSLPALPGAPALGVLASIRRTLPGKDGGYDVGLAFVDGSLQPDSP